jgi:two-component system, OmpR family, sensor histidine kinase QseC
MNQSIRTFLIINLLLSVTLILSLAIIGNLFLEHRNMEQKIDTQLTYTALRIEAFMSAYQPGINLDKVQAMINNIPKRSSELLTFQKKEDSPQKISNPQFQIWHKKNLLLKSDYISSEYIASKNTGFVTRKIDDTHWRIFTTRITNQNITVVVAENYDLQEQLESRITQSSIVMMLMSYPLLGLLIWIVVGRGLDSIRIVTHEMKNRAPHFLEPLNIGDVPIEIKPFIDELNTLLTTLEQTLQREKRFASDAAHELRTPLAALRAQTQIALQAKKSKDKNAALTKVIASIDRSTHVIEQLLTLCRMGPEANLEAKSEVDLVKQATEVIAELFSQAIEKDTDIELHAPDKPVIILGHTTAIYMLLRNLIDNAIKYTPNKSLVKVVIEESKNKILLKVIDNGKGISPTMHDRVFERFFRGLGETSQGCGLGLGIVQQVITSHEATINLKTPETGQGLEVIVQFTRTEPPCIT